MKSAWAAILWVIVIILANAAWAATKKPKENKFLLETHSIGGIAGGHNAFYVCKNGNVAQTTGRKHNKFLTARFTEEEVKELINVVESSGFLTLNDSYTPNVQVDDGMQITISYRKGSKVKTVLYSDGVQRPQAFNDISRKLNELREKHQGFEGEDAGPVLEGALPDGFCEK